MKRTIVFFATLLVALSITTTAAAKQDKTVTIDKTLIEKQAKVYKEKADAGEATLNDPSQAPALPNEVVAPSSGPKKKDPPEHRQASTSSCPSPSCAPCPQPDCSLDPAGASPPSGYPVYNLALVSNGSSWSHADLVAFANTLQDWFNTQYVYKWGVAVVMRPYDSVYQWQTSSTPSWPVFVNSSCPECEGTGYHDAATVNGVCLPYAEVQDQVLPTVVAPDKPYVEPLIHHETGEMVTNPACEGHDRVVSYNNTLYAVELNDPVEDYTFSFEGHTLENWQFPSYWQPFSAGPYNYLGLTQYPLWPVCGPDYPYDTDFQMWSKPGKDYHSYYCDGTVAS